ncbi:MAG: sigma-70 family RNA polymerase sigma factor [Melioribacteraceae bacterium]|nr:sigma-70 family RNA polymerase sigma factor [Melioribacteraceae bacterium]
MLHHLTTDESLISENNIADWKVTPDNLSENNELKEFLDQAIEKLPADYRVVFLLRDVEGLSTEETGKVTDLSIPAVKSRLHRARAFLRNELNEKLSYEK